MESPSPSNFNGRKKTLLFGADIVETGTVVVSTAAGARLKSTLAMEALERRNE